MRREQMERLLRIKDVLVVLLIPLLFTLLFGFVYSGVYIEEIPIAVLDLDHSVNAATVMDSFDESSGMKIAAIADTEEQLKNLILSDEVKGGIVIPSGFGKALQAKQSPGLLVFIDGTNLVVGNNLYAYASTVVATLNVGIQASMLEAGDMVPYEAVQYLTTLSFTDRMLYDPQMGYFTYVFAGILGILIQQTYLSSLIPKLMKEKHRLRELLGNLPAEKTSGKGMGGELVRTAMLSMISCLCCLMAAHQMYGYPLRGGILEVLALLVPFLLCVTAMAIFITVFFDDTAHCVQFAMFLSIPTLLTSGYIWPEFMMAPGFASVIKALWPLYYFCNPLRDVCLKGADFGNISPYFVGGLIFAAVWLTVSIGTYRRNIRKGFGHE